MPAIAQLQSPQVDAATACISIRNVRAGGEDWSKICNLIQYWEMANERRQALGLGVLPLPAAAPNPGCDCQSMGLADPASPTGEFSVANLQAWIEANCTSFVRSHDDDGNEFPPAYYDDKPAIDFWSIASLHAVKAAWLNNLGQNPSASLSGFYRLRFDESVAVGIADGAEGDYFYHPLWNELYATLRLLKWTLIEGSWEDRGELNYTSIASAGNYPTWDESRNATLEVWGATGAQNSAGGAPFGYSYGRQDPGPVFTSNFFKRYYYPRISAVPTFTASEVDFYNWASYAIAGDSHIFASYGADVILDRYSFSETLAAQSTAIRDGALKVGPGTDPDFSGMSEPAGGGGAGNDKGFAVLNGPQNPLAGPVGIVRWSGFEYQ